MEKKVHALKGRKHSLQHNQKIREALKGRNCLASLSPLAELERRRKISKTSRGRPKSQEVKLKISLAQKGRPKTLEQRKKASDGMKRFYENGGKPWNKGRLWPEMSGEKNRLWRGGVSEEYENLRAEHAIDLKEWRQKVLERDGFLCSSCGSKDSLCAHHIQGLIECPEKRFDVTNGQTLCNSCHSKRHVEIKRTYHST